MVKCGLAPQFHVFSVNSYREDIFLGLFVEAGRIKDTDSIQLKTAIRKVVDTYKTEIRLTPTQNILIVNVAPESLEGINKILADHGVQTTHEKSPVRSAVFRRTRFARGVARTLNEKSFHSGKQG